MPQTSNLKPQTFQRRVLLAGFAVYLFIYVFAVPMLMLDLVPVWGTGMGGFFNVLQGSLVALWLGANAGGRGWVAALLLALLAFGVEYVGVTTGVPFGRYEYHAVFGPKLAGAVSLPIPFAWLMIVPSAIGVALVIRSDRAIAFVAAVLVLIYDVLLEPFATQSMGYWTWIDRGPYYNVPTINFVAWFATGLALATLTLLLCGVQLRAARVLPRLPVLVYVLNVALVALVDLAHGAWLAALIGGAVLLACALLLREPLVELRRWIGALPVSAWQTWLNAEPE